jgi:hypothetical protein
MPRERKKDEDAKKDSDFPGTRVEIIHCLLGQKRIFKRPENVFKASVL